MRHAFESSRVTLEDLYRMPDDGRLHELEAGTLLSEPLPGMRHGRVALRIGALVHDHVRRHRLGVAFGNDTAFVLARSPDTVRGPDISFVRRERLTDMENGIGPFPGAPDLAVEVLSPSNTRTAVRAKVADYLAAGTRLVWVIDPGARAVIVHRSLLEPLVLSEEDGLEGQAVLPGFRVTVSELFEV